MAVIDKPPNKTKGLNKLKNHALLSLKVAARLFWFVQLRLAVFVRAAIFFCGVRQNKNGAA